MPNSLKAGILLVSTVAIADENFSESVILLCDHGPEGSYGLILNRPMATPEAVLRQVPYVGRQIFRGGPVQPGVMQLLHPFGKAAGANALEVVPGVWLGGDFEALEAGFGNRNLDPAACRFFLGYSGWGPGQLAGECRANAWMLAAAAGTGLVFDTPADKMFSVAIRSQSNANPMLANFPPNPIWN